MDLRLLSIEGTAWCFGVTIYFDGKQISKEFAHRPVKALDSTACFAHHLSKLKELKSFILENITNFDNICYSKGPGFVPCLKLVAFLAKYLHVYFGKKCYGINHGLAHIFHVLELNNVKLNSFLALYISGGNSILFKCTDNKFSIIGETLDIAVGNLLDKFAILLKLAEPSGRAVELKANESNSFKLYPIRLKGLHYSISGMVNKIISEEESTEFKCKSLLYSISSCLGEVCERARYMYDIKNLIVAGGVAQNKILQNTLKIVCKYNKMNFYRIVGPENNDNSRMIGSYYIQNHTTMQPDLISQIKGNRFLKY